MTQDVRWQAVIDRDAQRVPGLIYAVTTTGVYCRVGCASRLPRRENVRFFDSPCDAEREGFRACRRCRPRNPARDAAAEMVAAACARIKASPDEPTLDDLATQAHLSRFHFQRTFKSVTGLTPKQFSTACRSERLRNELATAPTVTAASYRAGFRSAGRVYATVPLGMTPRKYKSGAAGVDVAYAVVPTSLGQLLVAATQRGVCAIALGDSEPDLLNELRRQFPQAKLAAGDEVFDGWVRTVIAAVDSGTIPSTKLPLDVQGTAFQHLVWQALRQIPCGQTTTYADLAKAIGRPAAVRAVARACASNPVAVVVPCHRVVGSDGALRGYRWGVDRKRALLDRERPTPRG